jgi:hypothetical protein
MKIKAKLCIAHRPALHWAPCMVYPSQLHTSRWTLLIAKDWLPGARIQHTVMTSLWYTVQKLETLACLLENSFWMQELC